MKTKMIVDTSYQGIDSVVVNRFFTKDEKTRMKKFFESYIEACYPEEMEKQQTEMLEKLEELKGKGFDPKITQETVFFPIDSANNIRLQFYFRITWPNNYWMSASVGTQNLASHYSVKSAFLNEEKTQEEMNEAMDVLRIIDRAVENARIFRELQRANTEIAKMQENINELEQQLDPAI